VEHAAHLYTYCIDMHIHTYIHTYIHSYIHIGGSAEHAAHQRDALRTAGFCG
jgi:hypothetical protein